MVFTRTRTRAHTHTHTQIHVRAPPLPRYTIYKDHIQLDDYEIHDGMGLELYYG